MVRRGGPWSTILFSLTQGDQWEVLVMDAIVGIGPGGIPNVISLLQEEERDLTAAPGHGRGPDAQPLASV